MSAQKKPDSQSVPRGRVWPAFVHWIVTGLALGCLLFFLLIPLWLELARMNPFNRPEEFYAVVWLSAILALLAAVGLGNLIVAGQTSAKEQVRADQLRHAEIFGPEWYYRYLRDMTPAEAARFDRQGEWAQAAWILTGLLGVPAWILTQDEIYVLIPSGLFAFMVLWTLFRAWRIGR